MARVLIIEPFSSGSHAAWARGYLASTSNDASLIELPGQFWRWRMRASAATLADLVIANIAERGRPDAVVVSDMTDVSAFAGLTRHVLAGVPIVLYMHENQLAFPRDDAGDFDAAMRAWHSLLAADHVVFNSAFHRDEVRRSLGPLRASMPDLPLGTAAERVVDAADVVPVGVDLLWAQTGRVEAVDVASGPPIVLWNHRWDIDKQPEVFVRASTSLTADGIDHRVVLLGDDPWSGSGRRSAAIDELGDKVAFAGYADRSTYLGWLVASDVVVSVATHEYFGVAIVEAIAAGCVPVLPDRVAYPDVLEERYHASALYPDGGFRARLAAVVSDLDGSRAAVKGLAATMQRFDWAEVAPALDAVVARAIDDR